MTRPVVVRSFPPRREPGGPGTVQSGQSASTAEQAANSLTRELGRSTDVSVAVLNSEGDVIAADVPTEAGVLAPPVDGWEERIVDGKPTRWVVSEPASERQLVVLTPLTLTSSDGIQKQLYL